MSKKVVWFVVIIILILAVFYFNKSSQHNTLPAEHLAGDDVMDTMEQEKMVDDSAMMMDDEMAPSVGSYEVYSPEKLALADTGHVVLFFRASWCPTCRGLDKDIRAHLDTIPGNLAILDVNYDDSTELKKKYGVTYQHTLVQVDSSGNLIKKWMGSPTLSDVVSEII